MRVWLIANPVGTRVRAATRARVGAILAARHDLTVVQTRRRGHATELAGEAASAGAELVVVLGGDGTVNEVLNGLAPGTLLGLAGGGKTNVFARALGLPPHPVAASARLLELLDAGVRRTVSLGEASGRRFAFGAGLGMDGAIVREVERWRRSLGLHDDAAYLVAGLHTLATWDRSRPRLTVRPGSGRPPMRGFFAIAGNGDPYTYLGGLPLRPTPDARFEANLDLLVGQTMSTRLILKALAGMLSTRPMNAHQGLPVLHDVSDCRLEAEVPLPFQVDGEYLGDRTEVELRSLPDALTVVAPSVGRVRRWPSPREMARWLASPPLSSSDREGR
jgi:diacylglycerol kinase family enzyme